MRTLSKNLIKKLYNDDTYKEYCNYYLHNNNINLDLLKILLERYSDLLEIFLKINIILYDYVNIELDNILKDYLHFQGKNLYLEDIFTIYVNYYLKNYKRCRKAMKLIIDNKLLSKQEINLLKLIIKRDNKDEVL